jgi:hypothetical protein
MVNRSLLRHMDTLTVACWGPLVVKTKIKPNIFEPEVQSTLSCLSYCLFMSTSLFGTQLTISFEDIGPEQWHNSDTIEMDLRFCLDMWAN